MVNYRDLLVKYIKYIGSEEGTTFIYERYDMPESFTDEECIMLKTLELESKLDDKT